MYTEGERERRDSIKPPGASKKADPEYITLVDETNSRYEALKTLRDLYTDLIEHSRTLDFWVKTDKALAKRRETLNLKTQACAYCGHCDDKALRQGREYCTAMPVTIKNGHCEQFIKR